MSADLDPDRCAVCGWTLVARNGIGCKRGNCSQRPLPTIYYDAERAQRECPDLPPERPTREEALGREVVALRKCVPAWSRAPKDPGFYWMDCEALGLGPIVVEVDDSGNVWMPGNLYGFGTPQTLQATRWSTRLQPPMESA